MAMHDDLLVLARELVPPPSGAPPTKALSDAGLRRGASTAYYALFHLLVAEATEYVVAEPTLRAKAARTIQHKTMRDVCARYSPRKAGRPTPLTTSGLVIPPALQSVAAAFATLQDARLAADFDSSLAMSHAKANDAVNDAEAAFRDWAASKADPAALEFLADVFLKGLGK